MVNQATLGDSLKIAAILSVSLQCTTLIAGLGVITGRSIPIITSIAAGYTTGITTRYYMMDHTDICKNFSRTVQLIMYTATIVFTSFVVYSCFVRAGYSAYDAPELLRMLFASNLVVNCYFRVVEKIDELWAAYLPSLENWLRRIC